MDIEHFIESRGSVVATWELHTIGMRRHAIARALEAGSIIRVRQGWYANPWLEVTTQQAVRVGGQLACLSAARHVGLRIPSGDSRLHVAVDPNTCQLRDPANHRRRLTDAEVEVHWTGEDRSFSRVAVTPISALQQIALCQPAEVLHTVAESAVTLGRVGMEEWRTLEATLPRRVRQGSAPVDRLSGSGIESLFVSRLRRRGVDVRQQVLLPGVGYVDAILGERLVVELDGERYHRDDARDRRRDAVASTLGYRTLRFLADQVTREWPLVEAAVLAALARGDHLAP